MALENQSMARHNSFLGAHASVTKKIPHPPSTKFHDESDTVPGPKGVPKSNGNSDMFGTPSPKRRRLENRNEDEGAKLLRSSHISSNANSSPGGTLNRSSQIVRQREEETEDETRHESQHMKIEEARKTQLEEALPLVQSDEEAIRAYESQRANDTEDKTVETDSEDNFANRLSKRSWKKGRSSIYLDAFNLALSTVLEDEAHLFDDAEKQVFQQFSNLSYEAQYLYVRLFLRKTSAWFRVGKLGYYDDIADVCTAVDELQLEQPLPKGDPLPHRFPGELSIPEEATPLGESFTFAECSSNQIKTLNEASSLLLLDELKVLAKDARVTGKNKTELLHNLRRTSGKQKGLGFLKRSDTEGSAASGRNTPAADEQDETAVDADVENVVDRSATPDDDQNRDAHFTRKILEQTGKCVRLSLGPRQLFERVHLVFYRSTEWTDKSLTTIILAKIARRNFPDYIVSRSTNIFESRMVLLEFESCLRMQFRVDNILEFSGFTTKQDLEEIRALFEAVYPRARALLRTEQTKEDRVYESGEGPYLRRFSPAWVYTRLQHKVLPILAKFKEHLREHELICELLDQRLFHPSRRGAWYQRKALLEEHYMYALTDDGGRSEEANKRHWKRVALHTCETGLQDRECHLRYHYDLQKRIVKLEKQLRLPKREQHDFGHVGLSKAHERDVFGIQIIREDHQLLRRKSSNSDFPSTLTRERSQLTPTPEPTRRGAKTIWIDELETNEHVSVESLTLSHYRKVLGYKGYHVEGGIVRTLFGLLFYDVLFVYVPNVFQTAYQTCPLDLHTDAFYSTRISKINSRVNELSNGDGEAILRRAWLDHADRKTCIVGVRWDYEFSDLLEIVRCWDSAALGTIMRLVAQEYAERGGGVPDLFLWKVFEPDSDEAKAYPDKFGSIMFVEVKSENDRLSDSQRLWISVLLNAGVEVELCHVIAKEVRREDGTVVVVEQ